MRGQMGKGGFAKDDECRGDLVARERRGHLSGSDGIALRAHLLECASCRLTRRVSVDLDDASGVDLHDGVRIERLSMVARRWGRDQTRPIAGPQRRARQLRVLAMAASLVLVGGTASATAWWWRHPHGAGTLSTTPRSGSEVAVGQRHPSPRVRPLATASPEAAAPPSMDPRPTDPEAAQSRHRLAARPSRAVVSLTPELLLREASDARRAGDGDRAISLYRRLQQQHRDSPEAVLSAVALGGLLLDRRLPRAALAEFDAYLLSARGGALVPEALYGRGRALASLGDRAEERRTWERLLSDFPTSAYGPIGRRRLAELK